MRNATRIEEFLKLLLENDVDFVVIGGVALVMHGGAHVTIDLDVSIVRDSTTLKKLAPLLAGLHARPIDFPDDLPFVMDEQMLRSMSVLTLWTDWGQVDFLAEPEGIDSYAGLRARSDEVDFDGHVLRIASIDDLISMKQAAGRPKDIAHIYELKALKKMHSKE